MENNTFIIIVLVSIPFLIICFSIGLNSKINYKKIKLEDKWFSVADLITKKIILTVNFINQNSEILSSNPLISTIQSVERKMKNNPDFDKFLRANDDVNIIIEQINNIFDKVIDKSLKKEYEKYKEKIEQLNDSIEYSATIYNETVEIYNNEIKKIPFTLLSKVYSYHELPKFISNKIK